MTTDHLPLRLGMTMWSHTQWRDSLYGDTCLSNQRLARYARVFTTVEGNTTFYATPTAKTVQDWLAAVPETFRFTFKFPQQITHTQQLQNCATEVNEFLQRMSPLMPVTGLWKIQLPASFSPQQLPILETFLARLPKELSIGVEVRHPAFFAKGESEQALNRMLVDMQANRIIMDSRPVFSATPDSPAVIDAQVKKPRVPVHAIATANYPMIRFIGHPQLAANDVFFRQWIPKLCAWMKSGQHPYLFIHTPDNVEAPQLAERLYRQLVSSWKQASGEDLPEFKLPAFAGSDQLGLEL